MNSSEKPNWVYEIPLIDDMSVAGCGFVAGDGGFYWNPPHGISGSCNASMEVTDSFVDSVGVKERGTNKRTRSESCSQPSSKACREKLRRDKLNERFLELGSILEPEKPSKMDKEAILSNAIRMVTQLRKESQKLKDSNESLLEKINELKAEKNELRDEKQRLKTEKDSLEQQIKILNSRPSFMPHAPVLPGTFAVQAPAAAGHKLMMPVIGYPAFPMLHFMQPADVDTSRDAESCPPVA